MSREKYSFNKHYFDTIDSEEKAYWLGFIWCDGYVGKRQKTENGYEYYFELNLQEGDIGHLNKFLKAINSTHGIKKYKRIGSLSHEEYRNTIRISNVHFGKTLHDKYGIIANRYDVSKIIKYLDKKYYKDFFRGLIDGDGSFSMVYTEKMKSRGLTRPDFAIVFLCSIDMLNIIQNHLLSINAIKRKVTPQKYECSLDFLYSCTYKGRLNFISVINYLYKDSNIYLDRKYEKYKKLIETANFYN